MHRPVHERIFLDLCSHPLPSLCRSVVGCTSLAILLDLQFAKNPQLDSPRHSHIHAKGSILKAVRKMAPAGSLVMFCELENDQGWIFEATNGGELLERFNGKPVLEVASAEERDVGEVYFKVLHSGGLRIRKEADVNSEDTRELLMHKKVFTGTEVLRPAGKDMTFVKLQDGRGW